MTTAQEQSLIQRDLNHIWHPASRMKDFETKPLLLVHEAKGPMLYTNQGPVIDAISSWWCKSLGHGHPAVLKAMMQQLHTFEHIIATNTTHLPIIELGEKLSSICNKPYLYFASDGSSAVEIALKLAIHANLIKGKLKRHRFVALKNAYHGETLSTLGLSDLGIYKDPYKHYGVQAHFIEAAPEVSGLEDPLWHNAEVHWQKTLLDLEPIQDEIAAIIVEPLIQGASGMRCYSGDFLKKLAAFAKAHDIFFIADEIMTGMGRSGKWLACQHVDLDPDLICLSKGLTAGAMPLSCVLIDEAIYQLFYEDDKHPPFLHSNTYSGNALAIAAALATIKTIETENLLHAATKLGSYMLQKFVHIADSTQKISNIRSLGAIVAGDLVSLASMNASQAIADEALKHGALLRPIGNTLYWLPPLNTDENMIDQLTQITLDSIHAVYNIG